MQSKLRVYEQINQEKSNLDAIINISEEHIQEIYIKEKNWTKTLNEQFDDQNMDTTVMCWKSIWNFKDGMYL